MERYIQKQQNEMWKHYANFPQTINFVKIIQKTLLLLHINCYNILVSFYTDIKNSDFYVCRQTYRAVRFSG